MTGLGDFFKGVYYGRYDKTVHFTASMLMTFFGLLIWQSAYVLITVVSLGIVKELRDMVRPGDHFDWFDIVTNIGGVASGSLCFALIYFRS